MRSSLMVLASAAVAMASDPKCVEDISQAVYDLADCSDAVTAATAACKGDDSAKCAAEVSKCVAAFSTASNTLSRAVTDCGGPGTQCAQDITNAATATATASAKLAQAVSDCSDAADKGKCILDLLDVSDDLGHAVDNIVLATTDCKKSKNVVDIARKLRAYTFCEVGVSTVTAGVAGTTFEVTKALESCTNVSSANCTRDVTLAKDVLDELVKISPKVVVYCNSTTPACEADVAQANAAITKAPMNDAVTACAPSSTSTACRIKLAAVSADMGTAALKLSGAAKDCSSNSTAVSKLAANEKCVEDISETVYQLADCSDAISKAVATCKGDDKAACSADISACVAEFAEASNTISKAVTDCGGPGTQCAQDISNAAAAMASASSKISQAASDCDSEEKKLECMLDLVDVSDDLGHAIDSITAATTDCGKNATSAASRKLKSDVCRYEIVMVSAGVAAAAEEVAKAAKICANITDTACAEDVDKSKSIVDGLVPVVNRMVSGCGSANATCAADVNAVKSSLDKAQTPIGKAADSCKAGGSATSCKIDLAGTSADLAAAALDLSKAEKDCL
eukprot:TRINITY_DN1218_c0_g1_i4.p1 TRINITY_DN1218_c0_g1~~TRINITY_DN1218_c0_g1_i4.p1  ORF type:complete len:587 (+),score=193.12 TRINITY_DN1218_c0_g1_i4:55-1761(+)